MEAAKKELHSRADMASSAVVIPAKTSDLDLLSSELVYKISRYQHAMKGKECAVSTQALGSWEGSTPAGRCKACPAYQAVCSNCGKLGHYSTVCHQKSGNRSTSGYRKDPPQALSIQSMDPQ